MENKLSEITIIYIEDSDDVRFACEQTLTLAGYRIISCCDAEHSFPLIQSLQNIIILTDVRLPGISGLELLNYINEMDNKIPVILITGHGDVEMALRRCVMARLILLRNPVAQINYSVLLPER